MVEVAWYLFLAVPVAVIAVVFLVSLLLVERPPPLPLQGAHAFITGGSSGVGLHTALQLVPLGTHVTILARDPKRLSDAEAQLQALAATGKRKVKVLAVATDVTDYAQVQVAIKRAQSEVGPVSIFIHCAGAAVPGYFEELHPSTHQQQMQLHYMGAVHCLHALVPHMKRLPSARIILVSSMVGVVPVFGYTAYAASKAALRALAESLHMETAPYGTFVSLICPPDIDTPGFLNENKLKPPETSAISAGSGLFPPSAIASDVLDVLRSWRFLSSVGFDGNALMVLGAVGSPAASALGLLVEFMGLGMLRIVMAAYRAHYNAIVRRYKKEREQGKVRAIGKQH